MLEAIQLSTEGMNFRIAQQEVIANNLANVNTIGFKRDTVFQEELKGASESLESNVKEITVFQQGSLRDTKNPLDFALDGRGFFAVQTPEGTRYTRNGHFQLDHSGQLVLDDGLVIMGENGPIEVRGEITVNERGEVYHEKNLVDRFRIVTFNEPYPLKKVGNSLFALTAEVSPEVIVEGMSVKQGFLEESNVDPIKEMVNMMTIFRYFEADQKVIRTQDEILRLAVNEIGKI